MKVAVIIWAIDLGCRAAHFFALKVSSTDIKVVLNEESIGYDWMTLEKVKEVMQYDDEKKAFDILMEKTEV